MQAARKSGILGVNNKISRRLSHQKINIAGRYAVSAGNATSEANISHRLQTMRIREIALKRPVEPGQAMQLGSNASYFELQFHAAAGRRLPAITPDKPATALASPS